MKTICRALSVLSVLMTILPFAQGASDAPATLLVVPSRYTIVQLAFDIAKVRPVTLVAYEVEPRQKTVVLHRWDVPAVDWVRVSLEDYASGMAYRPIPARAVLVGSDKNLPEALASLPSGMDVQRIPTLKFAPMVNAMNETFAFTPSEWRWLARRHNLELKDTNAQRRRWGKYGPPDGSLPPTDASMITLPPTEDVAPAPATPLPAPTIETVAPMMPPAMTTPEPPVVEEKGMTTAPVAIHPQPSAAPAVETENAPLTVPMVPAAPVAPVTPAAPAAMTTVPPPVAEPAPIPAEPTWDSRPEDK
jgi:hypothetical protein